MVAQAFVSGFCPTSSAPSFQNQKDPLFSTLPSSSSSSNSCVQSQNCVSFRTQHSFSSKKLGFSRRLGCRNCVEKGGNFTEEKGSRNSGLRRKKLAVFVSGGGSNFRSIHEASSRGSVHGDIVVLVTNNPGCGGVEYAKAMGIPVILFPSSKDGQDGLSPADLVDALRKFEVDYILLAGYLKLIPAELIRSYSKSILNIHPSLLPAFGGKGYYGMKVHKAVIASGARYSGATIHVVDEHYDTGRILAQRVVPVLPYDTANNLAARVLNEEHQLYVEVTAALCEERIIWREDGVPLIKSKDDLEVYS